MIFYWELTLGIIIVTELIKNLFGTRRFLHSKWVMLGVSGFGAIARTFGHKDGASFWIIVVSIGLSVLVYDFVLKPALDIFWKHKNPLV